MTTASSAIRLMARRFAVDGYIDLGDRIGQLIDDLPEERWPLRSADQAVIIAILLREFPSYTLYILAVMKEC